ncbi:MAG: DUF835 domain-containing protein [Candidatus Bathyarchaeia archaeon]
MASFQPVPLRLSSFLDLAWISNLICEDVVKRLGYRMAWIGLIDERSKEVRPIASAGFVREYLQKITIRYDDSPLGRGPTGTAIREQRPVTQRHIDTDPRYKPWRSEAMERGYRSSAAFPMRIKDRVIGALNVYSDKPDDFSPRDVRSLQAYADQAALAVKKASQNERPTLGTTIRTLPKYRLEPSESYMIVGDDPRQAFHIFNSNLLLKKEGLCISREHPEKVREKYSVDGSAIFWLTDKGGREERTVHSLLDLSLLIVGFVDSAKDPIVLLDGLEYLVDRNGFHATYNFVQDKRNDMATKNGIMLIPVHPKAFSEKELALLERELKKLTLDESYCSSN